MDILKDKSIKNKTELLALAAIETENGLMPLKNFVANAPQKVYPELIAKTWVMPRLSKFSNESQKLAMHICNLLCKNSVIQGARKKLGWTWL